MSRNTQSVDVPVVRITAAVLIAAAVGVALLTDAAAYGHSPTNGTVVRGQVSFTHNGNMHTIQASDGSIINYSSFDILPNEVVRFIQPHDMARVLNRITGPDPTSIQGTLQSNGQVYIVNPAGVFFGAGAVVDVGGIYAAAGNMTDSDFINHVDSFTDLTGSVINEGLIKGNVIHLIGQQVANHGSLVSDNGYITMLAGNSVFIRQHGQHLSIRIDGQDLHTRNANAVDLTNMDGSGPLAVDNTGSIDAGRGNVIFGAGDLFASAIRSTGVVEAARGRFKVGTVESQTSGGENPSATGQGDQSQDSGGDILTVNTGQNNNGNVAGSNNGNSSGSVSGNAGGNAGGNTSGSTGGNSGDDEPVEASSGNASGNSGGNSSGNAGGNASDNAGGNSGSSSGGNAGGNSGSNSGGNDPEEGSGSDGNAGGNSDGNAGGNAGGNSGGNSGGGSSSRGSESSGQEGGSDESSSGSGGQGGGQVKVTICHFPPGNPANAHTITIGAPAVGPHIRHHGDTLGACKFGNGNGENGENGGGNGGRGPGSRLLNLAEGLPDGLPKIEDHVPLEPFALRPMQRLAIYMRGLRSDELLATVSGRELYDDTPTSAGIQQSEIATNRLRRDSVLEALNLYMAIFLPDFSSDELEQMAEAEDQSQHIREVIEAAWQRYLTTVEEQPDAAGFRAYLEATEDEKECRQYINGLHGLFAEFRIMGVTSAELAASKQLLLDPITPSNIGRDQLEETIDLETAG